jgi:signal transduction histidine kinase
MSGQRAGLRNKIITWSFVPTAIILVAVALVYLYAYQRVTENLVMERDRELTRLSARLLSTELTAYTDPLADQFLAIFDGIIVFDANGDVLAAEPIQYELRRPTWFQEIPLPRQPDSSAPIYSDVVEDRLKGDSIVVVVMPVTVHGSEAGGGVAGFFRLGPASNGALYRSIEKLQRAEGNATYLVDGNGQVIYHTDNSHIGADFSSSQVVQQAIGGEAGALRTRDLNGQAIVASYAPVPGTGWALITEEPWATLTASSRRYGQYLLLLLTLGVAVPTFIVTVGVRRITRPIAELIAAAREMAGGNFRQRIKVSTGDELESLAEQFNLMAAQLQESYAHLEQKVADRTRELATLNAIAAEVSHSLDMSEILNSALDQVLEVLGMEEGQAYCLDEAEGELRLIAQRGIRAERTAKPAFASRDSGPLGEAVRSRRPVVVQEPAGAEPVWLTVCIPLIARGRSLGALRLDGQMPRPVTPEELSLLAAIGQQIGVAVENAQLYEQAQQLAVVSERNRLARDLHDSVMQALYGVTLYAEAAARRLGVGDRDVVAGHLQEIRGTTQDALREMRLLIFELRPPILKKDGLAAALQARLEAVEGRVGLETEFQADECRLPATMEEGLYRIAQEALNNALKHAMCKSVRVALSRNGHAVSLEIADDGVGFDPDAVRERGGFGLRGMEERVARMGGTLTVQSQPGHGTLIRVEVTP